MQARPYGGEERIEFCSKPTTLEKKGRQGEGKPEGHDGNTPTLGLRAPKSQDLEAAKPKRVTF